MKKLVYFGLLLGVAGCTQKDAPSPTNPTGSNEPFTCQINAFSFAAKAKSYLSLNSGGSSANRTDLLQIIGGTGATSLVSAIYERPNGNISATFQLSSIITNLNGNMVTYSSNLVGTAQQTMRGGWSGTFAGNYLNATTTMQVRQGVFTDIQP